MSTSPSPLPATIVGDDTGCAWTIWGVPVTPNTATAGGSGAVDGVSRVISSTSGTWVVLSGTGGPNVVGVVSPGGAGENCDHVGAGRGVRNRSYCRSERRSTVPTPMSRAIG